MRGRKPTLLTDPGRPLLACLGEASSLACTRREWAQLLSAFALTFSIHLVEFSWCTLEANNSNGKSSNSLFIHGVGVGRQRRTDAAAQTLSVEGTKARVRSLPRGTTTTVLGVIPEV